MFHVEPETKSPVNNSMEAKHIKTGAIGERAVLNHLKRKGYLHLESNFKVKTGEIDLIVELDSRVHFIEVKTVSHETWEMVPHGTSKSKNKYVTRGTHRAEDNVHRDKLRKLLNTIQVWLSMNKYTGEWQLDVAAVCLDREARKASVHFIDNIIVE